MSLGFVALRMDDAEEAESGFREGLQLAAEVGFTERVEEWWQGPLIVEATEAARAQLGPEAFDAAFDSARASPDDVVQEMLAHFARS